MGILEDLTIVTVSKNNINGFKNTFESLRPVLEECKWIVRDASSTDGTKEFLSTIEIENAFLVSEKDEGIFDAMNRALEIVETKYVWFLNAGDKLLGAAQLETVLSGLNQSKNHWVVAGAILSDAEGNQFGYWQTPTFPQNWRALGIQSWCHQSTIYDAKFLKDGGAFDKLSIIADWSTALILEKLEKPLIAIQPIAIFLTGGLSSNIERKKWIELHVRGREISGLVLTRRPILLAVINFGTYWISQGKFGSKLLLKFLEKVLSQRIKLFFSSN